MTSQSIHLIEGSPRVSIHSNRQEMGFAAAKHVIEIVAKQISLTGAARVIFACAPSQDQFLESLVSDSVGQIDWSKVTAFHMDEYVGLPASHPASFRNYLHQHLLSKVNVGRFHPIAGEAPDSAHECARYAKLINEAPIDLICLGIGENGHLAFNDPPVADFEDPESVKTVQLDAICRQQQVNDGCFTSLDEVPLTAITLTLPVFRKATQLSIVVPGERKAQAVRSTCLGPVDTSCPASIVRTRRDAVLFLDSASAAQLR